MKAFRKLLTLVVALSATGGAGTSSIAQPRTKVTISYPTRSGASWPLYLAKDGGYYDKYGLDVTLVFGVHPAGIAMLVSGEAQMANYGIDPAMIVSSRDASFVVMGSSLNRGAMALVARKGIATVRDLAGRRIGVGRVGDTTYHYTTSLLAKFGMGARDVQWIPSGVDANGRAAILAGGQIDAALLTAPTYFKLETAGFKSLARLSDYDDIFVSTVYLFKKSYVVANPHVPELLVKAHAEAIKRFYDDKSFAVKAFLHYDPQDAAETARVYDMYASIDALDRVPLVLKGAVQSAVDRADENNQSAMKAFDYRQVIDNGIVKKLMRDGFFDRLFGPTIKAEEERKTREAFGL